MRLRIEYCVVAAVALTAVVALRGARNGNPTYEWISSGSLTTPKSGACAATLPDGNVLIIGGDGPQGASTGVDVYGVSGRVSAAPPTLSPHAGHACAIL